MRRTFAISLATAMAVATTSFADTLQVSYPTDAGMDCTAVAIESARMDQIIATANGQMAGADGSAQGARLASTVAMEGLARSGMLAKMPGVGMFANQAAGMARQRGESVKAQAAATVQTANTRKALLSGLYAGKSCDAPPPAPAPAAPAGF